MKANRPEQLDFPIVMWWSTFVIRLFQHVCDVELIGSAAWTQKILSNNHTSDSSAVDKALQEAYTNPPDHGMRVIDTPGLIEPLYEHEYSPSQLVPPPMLMRTVSGARTQALETCSAVVCATSSALEPVPVQEVRRILARHGKEVYAIGLQMPILRFGADESIKSRRLSSQCKGCSVKGDHSRRVSRNVGGSSTARCSEEYTEVSWHCSSCAPNLSSQGQESDVPTDGNHSTLPSKNNARKGHAKNCTDTAVEFMDHSLSVHGPQSVMLISFGSVVFPSLPGVAETILDTLLKSWEAQDVADRIPFVFATGAPMFTNAPELMKRLHLACSRKQCYLDDWIPQQEVLQHPAMGTFVMHCGYNSTVESIAAGVPIIAISLTGDQPIAAAYQSQTLEIAWELLTCKARPSYQSRNSSERISEELARVFLRESRPNHRIFQHKKEKITTLRTAMLKDLESGPGRQDMTRLLQLS
ncbi:hypothetical protein CBS101457_002991 [Exobasidium rhododendri]|nr:hypothetical protein CBS101457_002991 [Exobasidium rhododendri]